MAYAAMTFISRLLKTVPKDAEVLFRPDGVVDISAKVVESVPALRRLLLSVAAKR